jgi:hypothetical protein
MPLPYTSRSEAAPPLDLLADAVDEPRPFPSEAALTQLGHGLLNELLDLVLGSPLEDHVTLIAESLIGGLHTAVLRLDRLSDRHRETLARGLQVFDGSEVADDDLQSAKRATDAADAALRALELVRDAAAEAYATGTGECWSPWQGGVRGSSVTAAQVDAQHALRARAAARRSAADPGSQVVVFRGAPGATSAQDASRIFDALNWAKATWPDMSLALTGAPGAEQIARRWSAQKKVRLVLARPDFKRHGRSAPFRANDLLLELEPVCVLTLARSLDGDAKPFGPVLNLQAQAQGRALRCVPIGRKPPG